MADFAFSIPAGIVEAATAADPSGGSARFLIRADVRTDPAVVAARAVGALAEFAPTVRAMSPLSPDILIVTLPGRVFVGDVGAAYTAAYEIGGAVGAAEVEPDLPYYPAAEPGTVGEARREGAFEIPGCWVGSDPGLASRPRWAPELISVEQAWAYSRRLGRPVAGRGSVIAQLDTGLATHPVLAGANVIPGEDLVDGDLDPTDPLGYWGNPGHGTATASVIVSRHADVLQGVAPSASLLPIRCIQSVIVVFAGQVAEAIDRAVARGAHVVTMSLGGLSSFALERALRRAAQADVIILAAAGNCYPEVVFPAADPNCTAVGGCNAYRKRWRGSARGAAVDISAPAENVFRAFVSKDAAPGVGQGEGTSFAVAMMAGIAACWLAHHGRARVIEGARRRGLTVNELFRRLVRATSDAPPDWDSLNDGAGIANVHSLLRADLDLGADRENPAAVWKSAPSEVAMNIALASAARPEAVADVDLGPVRSELVAHILLRHGGRGLPGSMSVRLAETLGMNGSAAFVMPDEPSAPAISSTASTGLPPVVQEIRRNFAARTQTMQGVAREAIPDGAELPHVDDVMGHVSPDGVDAFLDALPPDEVGNREEMRRALIIAGKLARTGYVKLGEGPSGIVKVTTSELAALEAVVETDGTRPTFLLRSGKVDVSHPTVGTWREDLISTRDAVKRISSAVCRIQSPLGGPKSYFGTGTLVDAEKSLVLTNFHVIDAILRSGARYVVNARDPRRINFYAGVVVDFDGEIDRPIAPKFKVVEAVVPDGAGMTAMTIDVAMLRIVPIDDGQGPKLPSAVTPLADHNLPSGSVPSFCLIGFPAEPAYTSGVHDGVDWGWVTNTLFNNRFGLKRLAPGSVKDRVGALGQEHHSSVFTHTATTLGGSSGTLLYNWKDAKEPGVAIHFAGKSTDRNEAHAFSEIVVALRQIGMTI